MSQIVHILPNGNQLLQECCQVCSTGRLHWEHAMKVLPDTPMTLDFGQGCKKYVDLYHFGFYFQGKTHSS